MSATRVAAPHRTPVLVWVSRTIRQQDRGSRRRPVQLVVLGFLGAVLLGTGLLMLPIASAGDAVDLVTAVFTATSAVCVTGLVVVDTGTAWTGFGQVVILVLIQLGGFGVMAFASLLGLLLSRRLGLQARLATTAGTKGVALGDVRAVITGVARISIGVELVTALILTARWTVGYGEDVGRALWLGVFHAVSAFNNAGFALFEDSLISYAADPWICLPIAIAVVVGGLGFPVLLELWRHHRRPARWSLHTKLTVLTTAALIVLGSAFMLVAEWTNPATLGRMSVPGKLLAGLVQGVMPRTAGFTSVDTGAMREGSWLGTEALMFIGGGSASTAGGIKVTTFAILVFVIWSELRGDPDVSVFRRRIPTAAQRQAGAVGLIGLGVIVVPAIVISLTSDFPANRVLFEVISASGTVGLSTGITADLAGWHQVLLTVLMFLGRLGPITLGTALALRERHRFFRHPREAPIIG